MQVEHFIEGFDLRNLHWFASLVGGLLTAYTMQMWSAGLIVSGENSGVIYALRRIALSGLAAAFFWSVLYAADHPTWQPWPPDLAAIICLDAFMIATIVAGYVRNKHAVHSRNGTKVQSTH